MWPSHNPAPVIEVQMRQHDARHVPRFHPERLKPIEEPALAVIENLALDQARAIADTRAYHHSSSRRITSGQVELGRMRSLPSTDSNKTDQQKRRQGSDAWRV